MFTAITASAAGVLLLSEFWLRGSWTRGNLLRLIEVVVGLVATVLGIMAIIDVVGVALFVSGLALVLGAMRGTSLPAAGLSRIAEAIAPLRALLGIVLLVMGIVLIVRHTGDDDPLDRWRRRTERLPSLRNAADVHASSPRRGLLTVAQAFNANALHARSVRRQSNRRDT